MPAHIAAVRYGVLLIGFSEQERTLFASLFKVSGAYREWKDDMEGKPDCVLLDIGTDVAQSWYERDRPKAPHPPVIAVGNATPATGIAATISRPLRWSIVLETLESVTGSSANNGVAVQTELGSLATSLKAGTALKSAVLEPVAVKPATPRVYKTVATALIVNPNPKGWRYITGELAARGYRVDHVCTGEAAVLLLANFRYNAVFVEMLLPDEDGVGICRMLKQSQGRRKVSTIILSTNRKAVDRIRGTFLGCDAFLRAPIDADELHRTLDRLVPEYVLEQEK
ncbi:MAG: response regulator [Herminiimonas sp.]|nr:response regulator [Herminiimonas sp.]MDB5852425.1 response regulator [Herminiimonas sp.]